MKITLAKFAALFAMTVLFMTTTVPAQADCTGQIHNKMRGAYSFKVYKVDANEKFVEVQSGSLPAGASATIQYKTSYITQVVQVFENGQPAFSVTLRGEELANCNFGNKGGWAPYCLGIPRDRDITILARRYNCSKSKVP